MGPSQVRWPRLQGPRSRGYASSGWEAVRPASRAGLARSPGIRDASGGWHRDELTELRALTAAALRDVAGRSVAAVQEWIGPPTIDPVRRTQIMAGIPSERHQGDTRSIRRRIARGRELWAQLAAWPWWAVVDAGESVAGGMPARGGSCRA